MKNQKGITLITLAITIVVLMILISTISINAPALLTKQKKRNLETDIQSLKEEIDQYYARYESLPIINKYKNVSMLNEVKNINDSENYYVIDLSKISVNLNYGKDYNKIKEKDVSEEITETLNDVYIINQQSHTIYYPKGIEYEGKIYYTTDESYTQISDVNIIKICRDNEIFFKENKELQDSLGNKIVIPAGFKIAQDSALTADEGVVVEHSAIFEGVGNNRGDQYVWVPVGENIKRLGGLTADINLERYIVSDGSDGNQKASKIDYQLGINYEEEKELTAKDAASSKFQELAKSRISNYKEDSTGTNTTALNLKGFIDSVQKNGGFYIARFEATYGVDGKANSKLSNRYSETEPPKEEGTLWNFVTQGEAAEASRDIFKDNKYVETDLINSYAWDTTIEYIEKCSNLNQYSLQVSKNKTLNNTGVNNDEVCRINDLSSNTKEWTTEYTSRFVGDKATPCCARGGSYLYRDTVEYCSIGRANAYANHSSNQVTFRTILYMK